MSNESERDLESAHEERQALRAERDRLRAELESAQKLLTRVVSYDGGHEVITGGMLHNPKHPRGGPGSQYHYSITFTGKGWAITCNGRCLSRTSNQMEPMQPNQRLEDLGPAALYASAQQAFLMLEDHKALQGIRAKKENILIWHPNADRRYPCNEGE